MMLTIREAAEYGSTGIQKNGDRNRNENPAVP